MNIYFLGDIGKYNNNLVNILNDIKQTIKKEDIIILLGDNFYYQGVNSIEDKLWDKYLNTYNLSNKVFSILGNHDYQLNPHAQIEFTKNNWNMPDWYYTLKLKTSQIWLLDTCQLVSVGNIDNPSKYGHVTIKNIEEIHNKPFKEKQQEKKEWVEKKLKETHKDTKIVVGH